MEEDLGGRGRPLSDGPPSPSKPPSSSPNFPQPGVVSGYLCYFRAAKQTAVRRTGVEQTPAEESFWDYSGGSKFYKKSGYRTPLVGGNRSFCPEGKNSLLFGFMGGWLLRFPYTFYPSWTVSGWLASVHRRSRLLAPFRGSTGHRRCLALR